MVMVRAAKDWLLLIGQHWRVALPFFLAGALLYLGVGTVWPKEYKSSALLELDPAVNWHSDIESQRQAASTAVRSATTRQEWARIVTSLRLFPETVADGRLADAADYLASQVSVEQMDDQKHGGVVVGIRYASPNRELAIGVTQAVADNLARPVQVVIADVKLPAEPAAAPVASPVVPAPMAPVKRVAHSASAPARRNLARDAEMAHRVQTGIDEGAKLQKAFNENAITLSGLRQQLTQQDQKMAIVQAAAPKAAPAPERKVIAPKADLQIQNLRQQLVRDEQTLGDLRKRYTEDYPDVVAARDKMHDTQLDIDRLTAVEAISAKAEPAPQKAMAPVAAVSASDEAARQAIAQRLSQTQAVQDKLQRALDRNSAIVSRLQSGTAKPKSGDSAIAENAPDPDMDTPENPHPVVMPAVAPAASPSAISVQPANPSGSGLAAATASDLRTSAPVSPFSPSSTPMVLAQGLTVAVSPIFFAAPLSWLLSIVFGALAALAAVWLAERRDPSIRSEGMLRHVLPASAAYLGGIPRVRHEVIPQ